MENHDSPRLHFAPDRTVCRDAREDCRANENEHWQEASAILGLDDAALTAGNLPRAEVKAGLAELDAR
jgi:hypothetical protein